MYRHVDILNNNGNQAYVLHAEKGFRLEWFSNESKTICLDDFKKIYNPDIDFIIRGEGEKPLLHLVEELKRDSPRPETVPGIYYRDKNGKVVKTADAEPVRNIDDLPFPARELVLNCDYSAHRGHRISTSRGCPYSCSFCGDRNLWRSTVRRRSLDNVITELKFLKDNYKVKFVDIVDGTFTYDRKYLEAFCHAVIDQKVNLDWRCTARYDNLDEEILQMMKRANCTGMYLGFESGSEKILQTIDKKTSVARNFKVAEMIYNAGIPTETSFMLGLPSETREDIEQTLQAMRKVKTGILDVNSYIPLPGTSLYDTMSEDDRDKIDWRKVSYKSFDNYFCKEVPYDEFQRYLSEAYDIAKSIRNRAILHFGPRMLMHSLVGLIKRK